MTQQTTTLSVGKDTGGYTDFTLPPSNKMFEYKLSANTEAICTIPSDAKRYHVFFSFAPGAEVWVSYGATATLPDSSGNVFLATNSELNPMGRKLEAGTVIHFITSDTEAACSVFCYQAEPVI